MSDAVVQSALPGLSEDWSVLTTLPEDGPPQEPIPVSPADFLEAALDRKLRPDERRYLYGPAVLYLGGWEDTIPAWLEAAIPKARVAQLLLEAAADVDEYDRMCSLEEVAAYLYTACLSFPLAQEWGNVYFWASDQVMRAHGKLPEGQSIWDIIDPKGELGANHRELNDYERRECLDKLRRDIRRAVVRHGKKRGKVARRARKNADHVDHAEEVEHADDDCSLR